MKKEGEKKEERGGREREGKRNIRGTQFLGGSRKKSLLPKKDPNTKEGEDWIIFKYVGIWLLRKGGEGGHIRIDSIII